MRRPSVSPCMAALAALMLAACGRDDTAPPSAPAPSATGTTVPAQAAAEPAEPALPPLPSGDFRITSVDLGSTVDEEGRVTDAREVFAPADAIRAAVIGVGSSDGLTLSARWLSPQGEEIARAGNTLAPQAPTVATFTLSQPEPWPAGTYQLEVAINDRVVETRRFEVR